MTFRLRLLQFAVSKRVLLVCNKEQAACSIGDFQDRKLAESNQVSAMSKSS